VADVAEDVGVAEILVALPCVLPQSEVHIARSGPVDDVLYSWQEGLTFNCVRPQTITLFGCNEKIIVGG